MNSVLKLLSKSNFFVMYMTNDPRYFALFCWPNNGIVLHCSIKLSFVLQHNPDGFP